MVRLVCDVDDSKRPRAAFAGGFAGYNFDDYLDIFHLSIGRFQVFWSENIWPTDAWLIGRPIIRLVSNSLFLLYICLPNVCRPNGFRSKDVTPIYRNEKMKKWKKFKNFASFQQVSQSYKTFCGCNLQLFAISQSALAGRSSLVQCLWVRPESYPIVEYLKDASRGSALALLAKIRLGWNGLVRSKLKLMNIRKIRP